MSAIQIVCFECGKEYHIRDMIPGKPLKDESGFVFNEEIRMVDTMEIQVLPHECPGPPQPQKPEPSPEEEFAEAFIKLVEAVREPIKRLNRLR